MIVHVALQRNGKPSLRGAQERDENATVMPKLQFLGAAGTVTGSKYLLTSDKAKILVDCGMFQGEERLEDKNWNPPPIPVHELSAVLITHAHLDHTGYLPKLVQFGFRGKIYVTPSTLDLLHIMLLDAAHLQEEESAYHRHAKGCCPTHEPLYTVQNAVQTLQQLQPIPYGQKLQIEDMTAEFIPSGHILGSAFIHVSVQDSKGKTVVLFTGDMGRYHSPILNDPTSVTGADYILLESTYGNRTHSNISREDAVLPAIQQMLKQSGCLLIPAFTVGRTQEMLYVLRQLMDQKKIPTLPVYVDSPMAIDVTHIYEKHHEEHDLDFETLEKQNRSPFHFASLHYVRTVEESKRLNKAKGPFVLISANGMATGGRIMHHLMRRLPDPSTVLLFVGFQAEGTRGRELLSGAKSVKIFHEDVPVNATVLQADTFSAHGDYQEILQWIGGFAAPPKNIFLVHGEADGREGLKQHIAEKFPSWSVSLPNELDEVNL